MGDYENGLHTLKKLLDEKKSILVEDESGPISFMGCNYSSEIDITKISDLLVGIENEKEKAINQFAKMFKDECRDYVSCSRYIKRILRSATSSFLDGSYGLIIRYSLMNKGELTKFKEYNTNFSYAMIDSYKDEIDNAVEEIKDAYNGAANELIERYEDSEINFIGGGRGVSGLIGGMIVAGAAKGVSDVVRNVHYTGKAHKLKNTAEEAFRELYISEEAYEGYIELIALIVEHFLEEALQQILEDGIVLDIPDGILKLLDALTRKFEDEALCNVTKKLFCKFPLDINTYIFVSNNYINCKKETDKYIKKFHLDRLSKVDTIFKNEQLEKLDVDFPCDENLSSYHSALELYKAACKNERKENKIDYRKKELNSKFLFRIVFKQALSTMNFSGKLCNKYAYEMLGEKNNLLSNDIMDKCKNKYVIYSNPDLMVLEDAIVVYDASNKKSVLYNLEGINGIFLTFKYETFRTRKEEPKLIVVNKNGEVSEYNLSNEWEEVSEVVDATNFSINRIKPTDDIYYKESEGFYKTIHAHCYACKKLVWVRDSGKSYVPDYCGKCNAHQRELRYVLKNIHYKTISEQCTMENLFVSVQENSRTFNDENTISKDWGNLDWIVFEQMLTAEERRKEEEKRRKEEEAQKEAEAEKKKIEQAARTLSNALAGTNDENYLVLNYYNNITDKLVKAKVENIPPNCKKDYIIYANNDVVITYSNVIWGDLVHSRRDIERFEIRKEDDKEYYYMIIKSGPVRQIRLIKNEQSPILLYALNRLQGCSTTDDIENYKREQLKETMPPLYEEVIKYEHNRWRVQIYSDKVIITGLINSRDNNIIMRANIKKVVVNPKINALMIAQKGFLNLQTYTGFQDVNKVKAILDNKLSPISNNTVDRIQRNVSPEPINKAEEKFCAFCGNKIKREAKFCNYCGKSTVN